MSEATAAAPEADTSAEGQATAPATATAATGAENKEAEKFWYDGADDDTIGMIQNKRWESALDAVKAYKELEAFRGLPETQLLKLPKDMSDAEAMNAVYARLGMPDSADGYTYELPEQYAEQGLDETMLGWAKETMHKHGLNQSQFEGIVNSWNEFMGQATEEALTAIRAQQSNELSALEKEWGPAYKERVELGRRATKEFGLEQGDLDALESTIGTAKLMKMMANIGQRLGEASFVEGGSSELSNVGVTPQMAQNEKASLIKEIGQDAKRMALYKEKAGKDYERIQFLNNIINQHIESNG